MPKEVYVPSSSPPTVLAARTYPGCRIEDAATQSAVEARAGALVTITGQMTNVGRGAGQITVQLYDGDLLISSDTRQANVNETVAFVLTGTMPPRDWSLRIDGGHMERARWRLDDTQTLPAITVIVDVLTALTLNPFDPEVDAGAPYIYSGTLTRTDSKAGLGGEPIICERDEGFGFQEVGTTTTDAGGNYSFTATAPAIPGDYDCRSRFPGTPGYFAQTVGVAVPYDISIGEALSNVQTLRVRRTVGPRFPRLRQIIDRLRQRLINQ